jgi:hypothetical protein
VQGAIGRPAEVAIVANQTIQNHQSHGFQSLPLIEALENRRLLSADLIGSFAGAVPGALPPGGANHVTVRVSNPPGQTETGKLAVTLYLSQTPSLDSDALVLGAASRRVHLRAGQTAAFPFRFASPSAVSSGDDYLVARIDGPVNADGSANETIAVAPHAVAVTQPFVDLVGRIGSFPATLFVNSASRTISYAQVQVFNTGDVPARGTLQISMYASTDGAIDSNATMIGATRFSAVAIRAGGSQMFPAQISLPAGMAAGTYTLLASINSSNTIVESNTANNIAAGQHPLTLVNGPAGGNQSNHHQNNHNADNSSASETEVDVEVDTGTEDDFTSIDSTPPPDTSGGDSSTQPTSGDDSSGSDNSGSDFGDPSPVDPSAGSDF